MWQFQIIFSVFFLSVYSLETLVAMKFVCGKIQQTIFGNTVLGFELRIYTLCQYLCRISATVCIVLHLMWGVYRLAIH